KEHKTVHFPVFIMNHVAILPKKLWPKGIFVHWWVIQKGTEKISKSKGGAEPIPKATEVYGVDTMRLYYAHICSPFVDVEWDPEVLKVYKSRINQLWNLAMDLLTQDGEDQSEIDAWLKSILMRRIGRILSFMDGYNLRDAANEIFFEIPNDLRWYKKRGGRNREVVREFLKTWIKLMVPFTPHLAEELWEKLGEEGFVSLERYPEYNPKQVSIESDAGERLIKDVIDDIREIIKVTGKKPSKIFLYTAPNWKYYIYEKAIEKGANVGDLIKEIMKDEEMRKKGKEIAKFVGEVVKELRTLSSSDRVKYRLRIDEKYLNNAKDFLKKEFNAEFIVENAEKTRYDPSNKARFAKPLKPAIYIE
ncbi:MAG: leucine--tRNA ligase, partial [Thermoplasmata archaeon]